MKPVYLFILVITLCLNLTGCIAVAVVDAAVGITTTVVEGTVDVVDAVTPDVFSDDEDENEDNEEEEDE